MTAAITSGLMFDEVILGETLGDGTLVGVAMTAAITSRLMDATYCRASQVVVRSLSLSESVGLFRTTGTAGADLKLCGARLAPSAHQISARSLRRGRRRFHRPLPTSQL
jgi:hypothetical protein